MLDELLYVKHNATFVYGNVSIVLGLAASPDDFEISAPDAVVFLQKRPSRHQLSCLQGVARKDDGDYVSIDIPIDMAFLVLYHCGLVLHQLLDCGHHLQSQESPIRKISWTDFGTDISTACSFPCVSRRSSFRCDALS